MGEPSKAGREQSGGVVEQSRLWGVRGSSLRRCGSCIFGKVGSTVRPVIS